MISWPIKAALECELFDHVIVSTDDNEIAEIAKEAGAEVPFIRPAELSDDHTATRPVIRHAMQAVEAEVGGTIDHVCCIYATAAFTIADDLRKGYEALSEEGVLFSFAGAAYPHPIQRAMIVTDQGGVEIADPTARLVRTQDLREYFHDAGMFYWGSRAAFSSDVPMFSEQSRMVPIGRDRAFDIDEPEDWSLAEAVFTQFQMKAGR